MYEELLELIDEETEAAEDDNPEWALELAAAATKIRIDGGRSLRPSEKQAVVDAFEDIGVVWAQSGEMYQVSVAAAQANSLGIPAEVHTS